MTMRGDAAVQQLSKGGLHIAITMDGNGRWATARGLPRLAGHRAGVAAVRRVVERARELEVATLTLYAFSANNWRRPPREVRGILSLIAAYLRIETERLRRNGVRLEGIGRRDRLPRFLLREMEKAEWATHAANRMRLRVAVDYSSREAIAQAALRAGAALEHEPEIGIDQMTAAVTRAMAEEAGDVDLLIRTGGEKRISDFLLWESAYAELHFSDCMWPEFGAGELDEALKEFGGRERRFGGLANTARLTVIAGGR